VSGVLVRVGNAFAIAYATHIDNEGFQRFCVEHELGHYFLGGHVDALFKDGNVHESRANFASASRYELEADHFAAGLLMPRALFQKALDGNEPGIPTIQKLSGVCKTSLTATAIRYAQLAPDAVAAIMSTGDRVDYCFMSDELETATGIARLRKGEVLPRRTLTYRFSSDAGNVTAARRVEGTVQLQEWFGSGPQVEMVEDVLGLGYYGKTLTALYPADGFPSADDDIETEGDWEEPRFHKSRRRA
jgi:hypothetical protein